MIGTTLSHYRITAKLGEGGMGEVYRAEDTKLGREVAIKVLPTEMAANQERLERFQREAKVLASLNHRNIATLYGLETVSDAETKTFLAMELGVSVEDVSALLMGGHGDTMVPMHRYTTIAGIPISNFLSKEKLDEIVERTRHGGAEILALRQNSSAYDAPAASVAEMVDAIVNDRKRVVDVEVELVTAIHDDAMLLPKRAVVYDNDQLFVFRRNARTGRAEVADRDWTSIKEQLLRELDEVREKVFSSLTPWQKALVARHARRPYTLDYIDRIFTDFQEIHGDRRYADDAAIVAGIGLGVVAAGPLADRMGGGRAGAHVTHTRSAQAVLDRDQPGRNRGRGRQREHQERKGARPHGPLPWQAVR